MLEQCSRNPYGNHLEKNNMAAVPSWVFLNSFHYQPNSFSPKPRSFTSNRVTSTFLYKHAMPRPFKKYNLQTIKVLHIQNYVVVLSHSADLTNQGLFYSPLSSKDFTAHGQTGPPLFAINITDWVKGIVLPNQRFSPAWPCH